jgi:hypothetical protein
MGRIMLIEMLPPPTVMVNKCVNITRFPGENLGGREGHLSHDLQLKSLAVAST